MKRLRMSGLNRSLHCVASHALPWVENWHEASAKGTEAHRVLARVEDSNHPARALLDRIAADLVVIAEQGIVLNVATGEARLDDRLDDGSPLGPFEISGHPDAYAYDDFDEHLYLIDWKTGRLNVESARYNLQTLGYALAVARLLRKPIKKATTIIAYVERLNDDHAPSFDNLRLREVDEWTHEAAALDELAERLKAIYVDAAKQQAAYGAKGYLGVDVKEGPWCDWCPASNQCPAKVGLLSQAIALSEGKQHYDVELSTLTNQRVAQVLDLAKSMIRVVVKIETAAKLEASKRIRETGPIDIGDGYQLAEVIQTRDMPAKAAYQQTFSTLKRVKCK